ncbi:Neogenin [Channa argus]|uniref:Neogenin n=1 Tax=Channa argus TaxID=215402 RepID=A0A6G1PZB0_CHAAH|nr:Neogenin [Channa argus]
MSLLLGSSSAYELQDTIHTLKEENLQLQHRVANLTEALRDLKHLLTDHKAGTNTSREQNKDKWADWKPTQRRSLDTCRGEYGGGNQRKISGTLHLSNVTLGDDGMYICVTHNHLLNISKKSKPAKLTVHGVPRRLQILRGPDNITVATGTEVSMHCAVGGFPVPMVHWFKDGCLLTNCSASFSLQNNGQLLTFRNVSKEDEGIYHCEASNQKETIKSQTAFLLPAEMDWSFVQQPTNLTARKGENVTIICRPPYSRPAAQVSWFKKNQLLSPTAHITVLPSGDLFLYRLRNATLYIQSARSYDEGVYNCEASNTLGKSSSSTMLRIAVSPIIVTFVSLMRCSIGASVVLPCRAVGIQPITYTWTRGRDDQQSSISPTEGSHIDIQPTQLSTLDPAIPVGLQVNTSDWVQLNATQQGDTVKSAKSANDTELTEWHKKNTSQSPMTSNDPRVTQQSPSWLPVLEKHDIPIVVGVGVSLAFIFITVTFYSVVQKNEPAPTSRAVIEQSPNTSDTRARPPGPSLVTVQMEPTFADTHEDTQPTLDNHSVTVETYPEPILDTKIDPSLEEEKGCSLSQPSIQLQCAEDWTSNRGDNHSPCQDAMPPPSPFPSRSPSPSPPFRREEGLRSSLTLQSAEPCVAPIHHSLSLSHALEQNFLC